MVSGFISFLCIIFGSPVNTYSRLPDNLNRISSEDRVDTHEGRAFAVCLCHEEPVKRVFMRGREPVERQDMRLNNRQDDHAIRGLLLRDNIGKGRS